MQALIDDLTSRAKNLQVSENDLAKARYRAELVRVVRLLDLLKEGNPSGGKNLTREQSSELLKIGDQVTQANYSGDSEKVNELTVLGKKHLATMGIDKDCSSEKAMKFWRQEAAVGWISKAESPRLKGRQASPSERKVDVFVKASSAGQPMNADDPIPFPKQPDNYTTAVIIWNLLKKDQFKGLGPCLHLYEAQNAAKKWFPPAHYAMPIKKLFTDAKGAFLYAVDEDKEYVIATLSEATSQRDAPVPRKGVILRLDKSTLRDAALNAQENVSDAKEFKVEFHSSFLWIERAKSLPLDTSLNPPTRSKSAVLPFSSDYHIISFPKTDGRHHNHGSVGRFFKKIFPGH